LAKTGATAEASEILKTIGNSINEKSSEVYYLKGIV
jgi:hypothetical protein